MSTFMANKANIERKWYILDAAGKPLGKTAVRAADLLRGKGKVTFTPHADCGDNVIIINAGKAVLTGKKGEQKMYRTHSGWIGGLKETPYRILMQEQPELAMKVAVRGMMPRNIVIQGNTLTDCAFGHTALAAILVMCGCCAPPADRITPVVNAENITISGNEIRNCNAGSGIAVFNSRHPRTSVAVADFIA